MPCVLMHMQVARLGVPYVLMHVRGTLADMQAPQHTHYAASVWAEVGAELQVGGEGVREGGGKGAPAGLGFTDFYFFTFSLTFSPQASSAYILPPPPPCIQAAAEHAMLAGIPAWNIILDPGRPRTW